PRTRSRPCKRCAASARRKNSSISFFCVDNFPHECFEAWIASQRIKVRINLDKIDFKTSSLPCVLFKPIQRLIFLSKPQVDHSKSITSHITCLTGFSELSQYRPRVGLAPHACLCVRDEGEHAGIVV